MAEEIKELIEKIKSEGIQAAQKKAAEIESAARQKADEIISLARQETEKIIAGANLEARNIEANTRILLQQAGRDMLINLRGEIKAMLEKLVLSGVHSSLQAEEAAKIILALIKESGLKEKGSTVIHIRKEDLSKLEKWFISALGEEARKQVVLKPSEDIRAGFVISFDAGKSQFDFSDTALAGYISQHLKPELEKVLKGD